MKIKNLQKMNCKKLVSTKGLSRREWLTWRQKGIGGSDIASICGVNPFNSALSVYFHKIEKVEEEEKESIPMELGTYLEPFLRKKFTKWFKKNKGADIEVLEMPYILQHPKTEIALANIDGYFYYSILPGVLEPILLELKTTSERNYKEWEDDKLPDNYYLQVQWYLYVTGWEYAYIAFLIGNRKFDAKLIERNEEVINTIVQKAKEFWSDYIVPKIAPAPDGTASSGEVIDLLYPKEIAGKVIRLDDEEIRSCITDIENTKAEIKIQKALQDKAKQILKAKMGNAEIAICGDKKITWKEMIRKEHIVKESRSRVFRIGKYKENKRKGEN